VSDIIIISSNLVTAHCFKHKACIFVADNMRSPNMGFDKGDVKNVDEVIDSLSELVGRMKTTVSNDC
jgi:hypothetical protein